MNKVLIFLLIGKIFFSPLMATYSVGEELSISDQQMTMSICNGHEPNGSSDDQMSLSDYNGDLNGGYYYVTYIDMSASW
tara:strand:+ start:1125 stop:1361 length:237 start_codon:yes stop_codon:yes gene_type:complete